MPGGDRTSVWILYSCVYYIVCKTFHRVKTFLGVADAVIEAKKGSPSQWSAGISTMDEKADCPTSRRP